MTIDEKAMQFLEEHIPEQATMALKQAYWQALASENSVLVCEVENWSKGTPMEHLLNRAKAKGYFLATLQASHEEKNLYERLGFKKCCVFKEYAEILK